MTDIDAGREEPRTYAWWSLRGWNWSLNSWGARLLYSLAAGTVVNLTTGLKPLGAVVAVVLFVLTTAIVTIRRR